MLETEKIPASKDWAETGNIAEHRIYTKSMLLLDISELESYHTTKWQTRLPDSIAAREIFNMQNEFAKKYYQSMAYRMSEVSIQTGGKIVLDQCPIYDFLDQDHLPLYLRYLSDPDFQLLRIDMPGKTTGTAFCYDKSLLDSLPYIGIVSNFDLSEFLPKWVRSTSTNGISISEKEIQPVLKRIYRRYPAPN